MAGPATGGGASEPETIGATKFLGQVVEGLEAKGLRGLVDDAKARLGSGVAVMIAVSPGTGTPMLSTPTSSPMTRYTAYPGTFCSSQAMSIPTLWSLRLRDPPAHARAIP